MRVVRKVLHATDFSTPAKRAFRYAVEVAEQLKAELHVLHIVTGGSEEAGPARGPQGPAADLDEVIDALLLPGHGRGVSFRTVIRRGDRAADEILAYAREEGMDLIAIGTSGRRGGRRLFVGSVAEEVVRHAGCPVLTVSREALLEPVRRLRRILAPLDVRAPSAEALRLAAGLAEAFEARLDVLHVVEPLPYPFAGVGSESFYHLAPGLEDELRKVVASALPEGFPVWIALEHGDPAPSIVEFARRQETDLIVMAGRADGGLPRLLPGTVTERVMRAAACPVLVLHAAPLLSRQIAETILETVPAGME